MTEDDRKAMQRALFYIEYSFRCAQFYEAHATALDAEALGDGTALKDECNAKLNEFYDEFVARCDRLDAHVLQ